MLRKPLGSINDSEGKKVSIVEGRGPWMATYTGRRFYPLDPKPEEVSIEDIAHHLSNLCRYTGAVNNFYSVAQHSVYVSIVVDKEHALWGLLHDAAEAYVNDLSSPLKECIPQIKEVEDKILRAIVEKFGLQWPMPVEVKKADLAVMSLEAGSRTIIRFPTQDWGLTEPPAEGILIRKGWIHWMAKQTFLQKFVLLTNKQ